MISFRKRIDNAYRTAETIHLSDTSQIVIMSDVHRGNGNLADNFARNQIIYHAALKSYNKQRYTYIELGDGDELWECRKFSEITTVYKDIFLLLTQFFRDNRLVLMFGNHDIDRNQHPGMMDYLADVSKKSATPLFPGIRIYESLLLRYGRQGRELFLLHGHQADFLNDTLWRLARFLVRHVWRPLELVGFTDPTSAAKNNKVKDKIERRLRSWAEENATALMAGHTHRPVLPEPGKGRYFNDGCCVHPYGITAVEISSGSISLVKWGHKTHEDGTVYIGKDILGGPHRLKDYFT
jgi:UDP-2,3-diacylglucosamine pyrophosphatase LpxH